MPEFTIVAIAGRISAGKTTFCRYAVERYGGIAIGASDLFPEESGVARSEISRQIDALIESEGAGAVFRRTVACYQAKAANYSGPAVLYIDGMRLLDDLHAMWGCTSIPHNLVWLEATTEMRFKRHKARARFEGDATMEMPEFLELDQRPHEKRLHTLKGAAIRHIENNRQMSAFHEEIDVFMSRIVALRV